MIRTAAWLLGLLACFSASAQQTIALTKKDRKRDVEIVTNYGTLLVRLSDATPLHRDNFLRLAKAHYFDGTLFHRVIERFMIQGGDPDSRHSATGQPLGNGGPGYTIPAEFSPSLFHHKGALAAAREGDAVNPSRASSGSQFYIVQGRVFTDAGLDSLETYRLQGRKIPAEQREAYRTVGGAPHLDQGYTVFGRVVKGIEVVDSIAAVPTSKAADRDRPLEDVVIEKVRLVKRKKKNR